ncbi:MAG: DUF3617 domain-containing protein [Burkholderiaceae bacterium]|nr:DUF3617 domain-containing protein [Burkholderiaceae bacterium]
MKTVALSLSAVLLASSAAAQILNPAPAPGLWETQFKLSVNGQDMAAAMKNAMAAALKDVPSEQRAMAEQMMKAQGGAMMGGPQQECLSAETAKRRSDVRTMLADLQEDAPHCRYEPVKISGGTVSFKGRCNDPEGFSGDITGEMTMSSAKAWTGRWTGTGRMAGDMGGMPGLQVGPDGRVQMGWNGSGRWLAAACGNVKPE